MLQIKEKIGGMECDIAFRRKINILKGNSGTGKSWVLHLLKSYFVANGIPHYFVNYLSKSEPRVILEQADKVEYLLLDNADLYIDRATVRQLLQCKADCIIATRFIKIMDADKMGFYDLRYRDKRFVTEEVSY